MIGNIIKQKYLIDIEKIEKNKESTVGNVYIIYTKNNKYVAKVYDDLNHVLSMVYLHSDLCDKIYIPKIINTKEDKGYVEIPNSKYIVLYSFLDGVQLCKKFNKLPDEIIKKIAVELRNFHKLTNNENKYKLPYVPFCKNYNIKRVSTLHFDLTRHNIFFNENKIGFIDFDDAKYGPSVCDVAIIVAILFFSKKRGVDLVGLNLFIDTYYNKDIELKLKEMPYIKTFALNWIDYITSENEFDTSIKESFDIKHRLIEENF